MVQDLVGRREAGNNPGTARAENDKARTRTTSPWNNVKLRDGAGIEVLSEELDHTGGKRRPGRARGVFQARLPNREQWDSMVKKLAEYISEAGDADVSVATCKHAKYKGLWGWVNNVRRRRKLRKLSEARYPPS